MDAIKLVKEVYAIDPDILYDKSRRNDYWAECENFYDKVKNRVVTSLSDREKNWLQKIEEACVDVTVKCSNLITLYFKSCLIANSNHLFKILALLPFGIISCSSVNAYCIHPVFCSSRYLFSRCFFVLY